jgi:hypothetical protein
MKALKILTVARIVLLSIEALRSTYVDKASPLYLHGLGTVTVVCIQHTTAATLDGLKILKEHSCLSAVKRLFGRVCLHKHEVFYHDSLGFFNEASRKLYKTERDTLLVEVEAHCAYFYFISLTSYDNQIPNQNLQFCLDFSSAAIKQLAEYIQTKSKNRFRNRELNL